MAVELETLELRIEASGNGAAKALDALTGSLQNLKRSLSGISGKAKNVERLDEAGQKAASGVSSAAPETEKLDRNQESASKSAKGFRLSLSEITKAAGKVESGLSGIFNGLKNGKAGSILSGVGNLGKAFGRLTEDGKTNAFGEVSETAQKATAEMAMAGNAAAESGELAAGSAAGWQGLVAVLGVKLATAIGKVWLNYQKLKLSLIAAPFKMLANRAGEAAAKVTQLFSSFKRIAMYRLLRTVLKEISEGFSLGIENAYYFSSLTGGPLAASLDGIATNMLYLKNSIGAAVAPLINALAPAVEFVVERFVSLVNVVNQFLSALGVQTKWIKAVKYPTTYKDALDDATDSAEKLKKTILGLDEINALDAPKKEKTTSSGFTSSDYSGMFVYETVSPQISDFAAKIKEKVQNGDWAGIGTLLAQKINGLISKANSLVDWDNGIGDKITAFLDKITGAFNAFNVEFDGKAAGELVGNAIMTVFNTVYTLFDKVDFDTLAGNLTDFINGAFEKIDGKKIGETIHNIVHKLLKFLNDTIKGIDTDQ